MGVKSCDMNTSTANLVSSVNAKKSAAKTDKTDEVLKTVSNSSSSSKTEKKDDFKDVLKSKEKDIKADKADNVQNVNDKKSNDVDNDEEIEDIDDAEEKIKNASDDELLELLNSIVNMLQQVQDNSKIDTSKQSMNEEMLKLILEKLNSAGKSNNQSKDAISDLLNKLSDLLNNDTLKDMSSSNADLLKDILSRLSTSLDDKNSAKTVADNLINALAEKSNESNSQEKTLSLEELLNSRNSSENNQSNSEEASSDSQDLSKNDAASNKDDEFLNKLLNKDNGNDKISMFSFRNSLVQNANAAVQANQATDVNKVSLAKDLIQDIRYMATNSIKELTVKVNPQNLGQITIKIAEQDGVMKATLKANSKETTELMVQNIAEIKKSLDEQNIKIADVNVELYQEDTTYFKDGEFSGNASEEQQNEQVKSGSKSTGNALTEDKPEENEQNDTGNVNFLA